MFRKSIFDVRLPRRRPASSAAGFSLIELMVVLGVLAILATIVSPQIRRSMDNAKAQKCRNNLKQLHAGVLGYVADHGGRLPRAQTFEIFAQDSREYYTDNDPGNTGSARSEGWVAWVPKGNKYDPSVLQSTYYKSGETPPKTNKRKESHAKEFRDDLGIGPAAKFAVENGAIFDYVGDMSFYVCPLIRKEFAEVAEFAPGSEAATVADGGAVYRTYAMNPYFGCSRVNRRWECLSSRIGVSYSFGGHVPEPSKILLFTEVQPSVEDPPERKGHKDDARNDKRAHDGCIDPSRWDSLGSSDEKIHAVHPSSEEKGATCALAIFYDGHIESVSPTVKDENGQERGNTAWFLNRGWTPSANPANNIRDCKD